ncbi:hypothetical protein Aperf_G00000066329 [Anoplocephala perfoliata]
MSESESTLKRSAGFCGFLVIVFNMVVFATGAVLMGGGGFIFYCLYRMNLDQSYLYVTGYIMGTGLFLLLIGVLGCVGVCKRKSFCLAGYTFFLALVVTAEIVSGIFFLVYSNGVVLKLQTTLSQLAAAMTTTGVTDDIVLKVQRLLNCCGASGPEDYTTPSLYCCEGELNCTDFPKTGCNKVLSDLLITYKVPIGCGIIGLGVFEFVIILAACAARKRLKNS